MQGNEYAITTEIGGKISAELARKWIELTQRIARPVFIHDVRWFKACLSTQLVSAASCHIFTLSYRDQVIAVFPLQYTVNEHFGVAIRTWQIFWPNDMGINDCIIPAPLDGHKYLQLLMAELRKQARTYPWDLLILENVADTAAVAEVINRHPVSRSISVNHHSSKFLTCESSYEASVAGISSKFKKNNRRKRKNLEKLGEVTTAYYSTPTELEEAFERFLDVEAANWKGRIGTALRYDTAQCQFYRALIDEYAGTGRCVIHMLNLDGVPVAAQLALISGDTFYLLKIGYDAQYRAMGPGGLLIDETIKRFSGDARIRRISFVTGAKWNDDWAPQVDQVYHHYIYNRTVRGLICWQAEKIKSGLRQIKRKLVKRAKQ